MNKRWDEKLVGRISKRNVKIHWSQFPITIFGAIAIVSTFPADPISAKEYYFPITIFILIVLAAASLTEYE